MVGDLLHEVFEGILDRSFARLPRPVATTVDRAPGFASQR